MPPNQYFLGTALNQKPTEPASFLLQASFSAIHLLPWQSACRISQLLRLVFHTHIRTSPSIVGDIRHRRFAFLGAYGCTHLLPCRIERLFVASGLS